MKNTAWIVVVCILSLLIIASGGWNYLQYRNQQETLKKIADLAEMVNKIREENLILRAKLIQPTPEIKEVVFTFDDGPYRLYNKGNATEHTEIILDTLKSKGIKATFFVLGEQFDSDRSGKGGTLERYKLLLKRMAEEGHTIAIHDHHHIPYAKQSKKQLGKSLAYTAGKIKDITGMMPAVYVRSPGGRISPETETYLIEKGYKHTYWHIEGEPLDIKTGDQYLNHIKSKIEEGLRGIILMHDRNASSYLSGLIKYLAEKNIKVISLAEWEAKYGLPQTPYQTHQGKF